MRLAEVFNLSDGTNFTVPFKVLISKYNREYREYLKAAYNARHDLSDIAFCTLNHIPTPEILKRLLAS